MQSTLTIQDLPVDALACIFDFVPNAREIARMTCKDLRTALGYAKPGISQSYVISTISLADFAIAELGLEIDYTHIVRAVQYGDLDLVKYLCERVKRPSVGYMLPFHEAIKTGQIDIINWMMIHYEQYKCDDKEAHIAAAKFDRVDVTKWLVSKGYDFEYTVIYRAAEKGSLNCLKYYMESNNYKLGFPSKIRDYAIRGDHVHVLDWLYGWCKENLSFTMPSPFTSGGLVYKAVEDNSPGCLRWLIQHGFSYRGNLLECARMYAESHGDTKCLEIVEELFK